MVFLLKRKILQSCLICCFFICLAGTDVVFAQLSAPSLVVNLPSRTIELFSGAMMVKEYPVAIGKPSTPTPIGNYSIINKEINPTWVSPAYEELMIPSGPDNPLGYRWLGFGGNYGIHGTNEPNSIGQSVSNGCIRMHESDVEELYEQVPYNTPVKILYDRINIKVDQDGQASIGIYPDVYSCAGVSVEDVKKKLASRALSGFISEETIQQLVAQQASSQIPFAQVFTVMFAEKGLSEPGVVENGSKLVPVRQLAEMLKMKFNWDEEKQQVTVGEISVPGVLRGERIYVTAENLSYLFGGQQKWNKEKNILDIKPLFVCINNKPVYMDVQEIGGLPALPARVLAKTFGCLYTMNLDTREFVLHKNSGKILLPVQWLGTEPYLQITQINEIFDVRVYWNQEIQTIELTLL